MRPWLTAVLRRLLERMEGGGGQPAAALAEEIAPPKETEVPLAAPPAGNAPASDGTPLLQALVLDPHATQDLSPAQEAGITPPVPKAPEPLAVDAEEPAPPEEPVDEVLPMVDAPAAVMEEEQLLTPNAPTPPPRPSPTYFTAIRMPDEYARRMLSPQFANGTPFRRTAQDIVPAPLPPSGLPWTGVPGVFQRGHASPPPAPRALQNWPAPTSTYNTFP